MFSKPGSKNVNKLKEQDPATIQQILDLLHKRCGADLTINKLSAQSQVIASRMTKGGYGNLLQYFEYLQDNQEEQDILLQELLMPVTSFFRDDKTLQVLCDSILPGILASKTDYDTLRIWVAGCSTGEEAFSIAIYLQAFLAKLQKGENNVKVQIFATDISEAAIDKARSGTYTKSQLAGISPSLINTYFKKSDSQWRVKKEIRDMVVFAVHNFLNDPPIGKIDIIICRNCLVNINSLLQQKALTAFHYSLNENGVLLLGKSENTNAATDLFLPMKKKEKIFTRKSIPGRFRITGAKILSKELESVQKKASMNDGLQTDYLKNAETVLLTKYTPAAVVINDQMDIMHIHGIVSPYLQPSPGKPTFNLLKMANKGLSFELRNAVHKARLNNKPVIKEGILLQDKSSNDYVNIGSTPSFAVEVVPLTNTVEPYYLVLFSKRVEPDHENGRAKNTGNVKSKNQKAEQRIAQLEKELAQTREDMRSITEEQEAANEELQSANEELQSSSEELQSLNEELETSEEELLSSNEELMVVNQELIEKQEQLNAARLYAESIVSTIREPLIVLDDRLRIKTANHSFYRRFLINESDTEGKLFFELQNGVWNDEELLDSLQKIIRSKMKIIDYEIELDFPLIGKRIIQLNARQVENENEKNKEVLILVALEDITEKKKNERLTAETKTRNMAEMMRQMIWTATADGKINYINNFTCDYTGYDAGDLQENVLEKLLHPADLPKTIQEWKRSLETGESLKLETRIINDKGFYCWHLCQVYPEKDVKENITAWIFGFTEIQDQKNREQEKNHFISLASQELKTALTSLKGYAMQVHENIVETNHKKALTSSSRLMNQVDELLVKDILDVNRV